MKELIPMNEYGIFVSKADEEVRVSSRVIATLFEKMHKDVLRAIDKIVKSQGLSKEFKRRNFTPHKYTDNHNKEQREYQLTRDGFVMVTMSFTGERAMKFKEWYITKFNEMEQQLATLRACRLECPELTKALKELDSDNKFIYSNEFDMINRIVLNMSTKDFRELHHIKKGESIRPYLTDEELKHIKYLQKYDAMLIDVVPDYNERKERLKVKFDKLK